MHLHFPVTIHINDTLSIPLHSITEILAYFIGYRYFHWLKKKKGDPIDANTRWWTIIGAIFGAIIGSRLVGGLENVAAMMHSNDKLLYFFGNKTVLGGFLGGLFGVELAKKIISEQKNTGDLLVYPIILGLIIGRMGCFSMGVYEECYGIPTHFFTGMDLGDGIPRHPTSLYEMAYLLVLWGSLILFSSKYQLQNGLLFKIFLISYCIFRFFIDFIKPNYNQQLALSTIQIVAFLGLLYYLLLYLMKKHLFSFSKK